MESKVNRLCHSLSPAYLYWHDICSLSPDNAKTSRNDAIGKYRRHSHYIGKFARGTSGSNWLNYPTRIVSISSRSFVTHTRWCCFCCMLLDTGNVLGDPGLVFSMQVIWVSFFSFLFVYHHPSCIGMCILSFSCIQFPVLVTFSDNYFCGGDGEKNVLNYTRYSACSMMKWAVVADNCDVEIVEYQLEGLKTCPGSCCFLWFLPYYTEAFVLAGGIGVCCILHFYSTNGWSIWFFRRLPTHRNGEVLGLLPSACLCLISVPGSVALVNLHQ